MSVIGSNILAGASGGAGGGEALYVDDVFSTWTYDGTGSAQTITNEIDLDGEGGLVWFKQRTTTYSHALIDTERGGTKWLRSNSNEAEATDSAAITSFNSNGFTLGTSDQVNNNTQDHVSWAFRKAPGFFDVVTFSATTDQIPHSLGSTPGMIVVKRTDSTGDWWVYHRSFSDPTQNYMKLNDSTAKYAGTSGNWEATSTYFKFNIISSGNYVAYLFAHDDQSFGTNGDEAIIKCDKYVGAGSGTVKEVDLGFEPQWVMIKKINGAENWLIFDNMRGVSSNGNDAHLVPNEPDAEVSNADRINFTSTGFNLNVGNMTNESGKSFMYVAIRRPHKPPEAGTDVFAAHTSSATNGTKITTGFPIDMQFARWSGANVYNNTAVNDRIRGVSANDAEKSITLITSRTDFETSGAANALGSEYWDNTGFRIHSYASGTASIYQSFRRAPGFLDVVAYNGSSSSAQTIQHNLGAVPEMMIVKKRSASDFWAVYHSGIGNNAFLRLNTDADKTTPTALWDTTTPTATHFTVGNDPAVNDSGATYIAYLFATLSGVSKVGTYDGTGNNVDVDCGFAAGARFVMIKRTDIVSSGDWYIWDTARGIVSGNDPYFLLNSTTAEVTTTDYIDPLNAGFTVTSSAPAALNASGGTYAFLAIS